MSSSSPPTPVPTAGPGPGARAAERISGCGCLLGVFSLAIMGVSVYEIWSWLQSVGCAFAGTYCY